MTTSVIEDRSRQRESLQKARTATYVEPHTTDNPSTDTERSLSPDQLRKINAYWRAANYVSVGQIYLCANPLLREPLKLEHVKKMLPGHWGSAPGQNFIPRRHLQSCFVAVAGIDP
jgi:hypothetical protein